jgi:maleylacetate reductase
VEPQPLRFRYTALPGRIVFGAGSARTALAEEFDRLAADRVLLVATETERPLAEELAAPLGERVVTVFSGVRQHVPLPVAEAVRALAASVRADAVLSVGGGSTTGTAKAVALTTGLPIVAVPTTYAGSEVTPVWGLTEGNRKTTGTDPRVLPKVVVYDPELTLTLPAELSAASGLNAMAHCVEAFWAPRRNPISTLAAQEGIRALAAALPTVVEHPTDLDARAELLYGAYLAGSAFAVAGSGLHHKICHVLGGSYDLPHAQTHAIVLPEVLAFNAPAAPDAAARIATALGVTDPVAGLRALSARLGIPPGLRALGMTEQQVDEAAELVEPAVPADNPRPAGRAELREIIHAAWAGTAELINATTRE